MNVVLMVLIALGALAAGVAAYSALAQRERQRVLGRAAGDVLTNTIGITADLRQPSAGLLKHIPEGWVKTSAGVREKLVQAGYDGPTAPLTYATIRLGALVILPLLVASLGPQQTFRQLVMYTGFAVFIAWIVPAGMLDRAVRLRQKRIRRAVPDALDLLVVCVEAGTSLDAAILRVAKETQLTTPDLSAELMIVNRKTNAGAGRDEALRGLATRTGVPELRALVSSMIQSEKWGTSIANVLRVNAEGLRRKRRQAAEQEAHKAPLKMLFPLVAMILPALFIVIMGPAVMKIMAVFAGVGR
jgi:tight adherence protein C